MLDVLGEKGVQGDAAHFGVLQRAGIIEAESVVITSHNDDMDIYLTIFCRKLRPDIQIISRATYPENIQRLHRAGADIVLSYSSMGSNLIFNYLQKSDTLLIAEGLSVFRAPVAESVVGRNLVELALRASTGCNVIAVIGPDGKQMDVQPLRPLAAGEELLLIGDGASEKRFFEKFGVS
ncbi:MAG: voltage-gated potassium channel [Verrucomicrobia bacterium ADurb.Bin474]|nr:MAG: voltage-gated potassium channel [Verrucomicrobia bacterium ADurb.Bin474]